MDEKLRAIFGLGSVRATQKRDQPLGELRQLIPLDRAFSFLAAQMRLRKELAKIFVTGGVCDQDRKNRVIFHRQFAADDWTHIVLARCDGKPLRAVNAVAIKQRHGGHSKLGRRLSQLLRERSAAQEAKRAARMK